MCSSDLDHFGAVTVERPYGRATRWRLFDLPWEDPAGQRDALVGHESLQGELYRALRARGWRLESAAFPRWRERVLALARTDPQNPLARFAGYYSAVTPQLMRRLESVMAVAMPAEDAGARAALAPHGITCPSVASLLDPWLDRAVRDGRLPEPARAEVLGTAHAPTLLPLDTMAAPWTAGLPEEEARLLRLYSRAKARQWDAEKRLDWSLDLDPENPEALPEAHVPIFGSPVWSRLTEREKIEVKRHYQGWQLSQFFAGEQGALLCANRIVSQAPTATAPGSCRSSARSGSGARGCRTPGVAWGSSPSGTSTSTRSSPRTSTSPAASIEVGREVLTMVGDALEDERRVRASEKGRFLDIAYTDLVSDPIATVRRILDAVGRRLDADGEARIRGWMAAQKKAPAHRYGLGDFGLHSQDLTQMAGVV